MVPGFLLLNQVLNYGYRRKIGGPKVGGSVGSSPTPPTDPKLIEALMENQRQFLLRETETIKKD